MEGLALDCQDLVLLSLVLVLVLVREGSLLRVLMGSCRIAGLLLGWVSFAVSSLSPGMGTELAVARRYRGHFLGCQRLRLGGVVVRR